MGLLIWSLKDLKECIEKMVSKEVMFDCIIFIEGKRGEGKSTLAYKILSGLDIEMPFKPRRDIVYSREDTLKHLSTKINGCIFSDEMINVAYKRDFYIEDQKELLKAFDMYRDSRNVFIGCIPQFIDLDIKIQKVCKIKLSVVRRGIALIHLQMPSIYSSDPWDVRNNQKIESKWTEKGSKNPRYAQLTTVRGILPFGDLPAAQRREYDEIKKEKRNRIFAKYQDNNGGLKDSETVFYEKMLEKLKAGKLNKESFELLCSVSVKDTLKVRQKINFMLKKAGDQFSFRDYMLTPQTRKRKDMLGFVIPTLSSTVKPEPLREIVPVVTKQSEQINVVTVQGRQEKGYINVAPTPPISEEKTEKPQIDANSDEDLFGFAQ